ncbi:MAG TPA: SDR family oxidoreductase [Polyangiaceae bacterium]|nr:SDR family oxidoreductase [Polyangiaceae bacterium]
MPRPGYDETTLLTGFPSFLARKLARHILEEQPHTLVYAVVRAKFAREAQEVAASWPEDLHRRFIMIEGDAAAMDLGLSGAEFRWLTGEIDRIHHAAQVTYLGVDAKTAEQLNVGGAKEIIEFAKACPSLKALVFHSTTEVFGDRTGEVREDELLTGQSFPTFVAETRARAEATMRRAMSRLPVSIVRPTTIVGDSTTGEIDRFDGPYLLILLIVTTPAEIAIPLPGRGDTALNVVPIDYVVRAAHAIGRDPRSAGRTFHVVDPNPVTAKRTFELVARASDRPSPRGFIPTNLTRALLRTPGLERFAKSPRAFVERLSLPVRFDARNTDEILAGTGVACPPFESYVDAIVQYVRDRIREKRERRDFEASPDDERDPLER